MSPGKAERRLVDSKGVLRFVPRFGHSFRLISTLSGSPSGQIVSASGGAAPGYCVAPLRGARQRGSTDRVLRSAVFPAVMLKAADPKAGSALPGFESWVRLGSFWVRFCIVLLILKEKLGSFCRRKGGEGGPSHQAMDKRQRLADPRKSASHAKAPRRKAALLALPKCRQPGSANRSPTTVC